MHTFCPQRLKENLVLGKMCKHESCVQANRASLAELKAFQEKVRLEDEIAEEAVKEAARAHVEAVLERGIEATKRRTRVRDYSDVVKVGAFWFCFTILRGSFQGTF